MKHKTINIIDLITLFMFAICLMATTAISKTMASHLSAELILTDENHTLTHINNESDMNESLKGKIVFLRYSVEDEGYRIYSMDTNGVIQGNAITNGTNREHSLSAIWVFD